jgi:hypothetical protein
LVDYQRDPWELENLAVKPSLQRRLARLREMTRRGCKPRPPGFAWG